MKTNDAYSYLAQKLSKLARISGIFTAPIHYIKGPHIVQLTLGSLNAIQHGDGNNQVDIRKLDVSEGARVILHAHGTHSGGKHQIGLYSSLGFDNGFDYTAYNFQALKSASKGKPVNVELFSCYGGYAIVDINHLPEKSTLITFVDGRFPMWSEVNKELIAQSRKFIQPSNPFTRFASYLLINANSTRIAVNTADGNRYFMAQIDTLKNYSDEEIKTWQKERIKKFASFLEEILPFSDVNNQNYIREFQQLIKSTTELKKFIDSFDIKRYKEILLANLILQEKTSLLRTYLKNNEKVNLDAEPIINAFSFATANGNLEIIEILLKGKIDINLECCGSTALYRAAEKGDPKIVRILLERGAEVNKTIKGGFTPLHIATQKEDIEVIKLLIKAGADPNITASSISPAEMKPALLKKIVKELFKEAIDNGDIKTIEVLSKHNKVSDEVGKGINWQELNKTYSNSEEKNVNRGK